MKSSIIIKIFLFTFLISSLNAKIIEVDQLFNKTLTKVKEEKIGEIKDFYGKTKINEENVVDIVTRYDGFVTDIYADKMYMNIKKDDKLFSIYSDTVLSIQKELKVSKNVNKNLYKSSIEKLIALDIKGDELKKLEKSTKSNINISVRSPINAIVIKKNINKGSAVKKGKLLLQLANIEELWFEADIYQKDISFIKLGMPAKIYIDGISKTIKSKIDYIYPYIDPKTKKVKVRFLIENKNMKLYPNMFAKVKIQNTKKVMLTLPNTAVLNKGSKFYVFKPLSDKEFEPIEVEVKRISSNKYEILDGLEKGEDVINNALFLLDSDAVTNGLYEEDDDDW